MLGCALDAFASALLPFCAQACVATEIMAPHMRLTKQQYEEMWGDRIAKEGAKLSDALSAAAASAPAPAAPPSTASASSVTSSRSNSERRIEQLQEKLAEESKKREEIEQRLRRVQNPTL